VQANNASEAMFDVIVVGAGAAGLFCAGLAGQRGLAVLLIDHADKVAEKIRISGGGRCNFTNTETGPGNFISRNPDFCRSALARFTPADFIALLERHRVGWHEKHRGQLFCDEGSQRIIDVLLDECAAGAVTRWQPCKVGAIVHDGTRFVLQTERGAVSAPQLVIATGGLSVPKIGASDFGYRLARQFGHPIVEPRPALVPLTFEPQAWRPFAALAGVALQAGVATGSGTGRVRFVEDLLFTHRGLSGPAILQISSYWSPGESICIDLAGDRDLGLWLRSTKAASRRQLGTELAAFLPQRLVETWLALAGARADRPIAQCSDRELDQLAHGLRHWTLTPTGTEGWRKAEVTVGGVDTRTLDSTTMQSRLRPGLHFIGEVLDVTGWLGGYNFQWAWASAAACARALAGPPGAAGT
jgi:predicted Rossmann fold flavoprotein